MGDEFLREVPLQDMLLVVCDVHSGICQMRIVVRLKGVESVGVCFRCPVASQQVAVEIDTHFWNYRCAVVMVGRSHLNTRHEVLFAVGAQLTDRQLASCQHHRLCQVFEHERQC